MLGDSGAEAAGAERRVCAAPHRRAVIGRANFRRNAIDRPMIPAGQRGKRDQAGRMFWFTRKKLVGSYFFLMVASRS